jgi:hypothetical protein
MSHDDVENLQCEASEFLFFVHLGAPVIGPGCAGARRPFGKLRAGSQDRRQDAGATFTFKILGGDFVL